MIFFENHDSVEKNLYDFPILPFSQPRFKNFAPGYLENDKQYFFSKTIALGIDDQENLM